MKPLKSGTYDAKVTGVKVDAKGRVHTQIQVLAPKPDPVNHPSHYTQGSIECIDAIEAALGPVGFLEFLRGQVIKYNWRLSHKGNPLQDGQKAQWYQNLMVRKLAEAAVTGGSCS